MRSVVLDTGRPELLEFFYMSVPIRISDANYVFITLADLILLAAVAGCVALLALVVPRLSLVLPAVALGEQLSLRLAWRRSRGNTLRLLLATFLCGLPALLLSMGTSWWVSTLTFEGLVGYVVDSTIVSVGYAILTIVGVTLISLSYRFLSDRPPRRHRLRRNPRGNATARAAAKCGLDRAEGA